MKEKKINGFHVNIFQASNNNKQTNKQVVKQNNMLQQCITYHRDTFPFTSILLCQKDTSFVHFFHFSKILKNIKSSIFNPAHTKLLPNF